MNEKEFVSTKVVISGDIVEVYRYENGYMKGGESPNKNGRRGNGCNDEQLDTDALQALEERQKALRLQTTRNAQKAVRRLVNANMGRYGKDFTEKFLTLTFADHVTDIETANYEFLKFIQRANYQVFKSKQANLKYIAVPELTEIGRIHYHVILFNIPFIRADKLAEIWANGFIKINRINRTNGNAGAYIAKYMTKDGDWLKGKKSYLTAKGLVQPEEITNEKRAKALADALPSYCETYSNTFENDNLGIISYKQYNIQQND